MNLAWKIPFALILAFGLSITLSLISCQTTSKISDLIKPGMSTSEVTKSIKAKPYKTSQFGNIETWFYAEGEGNLEQTTIVRFKDDKVFSVDVNEKTIKEASPQLPSTETEKAPLKKRNFALPSDLGQACHYDADCTSKNCWLNQCAGPENCLVPLGGKCVFETDCCQGNCQGGTCLDPR